MYTCNVSSMQALHQRQSLHARNVTCYVIVFFYKSFDIFGAFGVADFAFLNTLLLL